MSAHPHECRPLARSPRSCCILSPISSHGGGRSTCRVLRNHCNYLAQHQAVPVILDQCDCAPAEEEGPLSARLWPLGIALTPVAMRLQARAGERGTIGIAGPAEARFELNTRFPPSVAFQDVLVKAGSASELEAALERVLNAEDKLELSETGLRALAKELDGLQVRWWGDGTHRLATWRPQRGS